MSRALVHEPAPARSAPDAPARSGAPARARPPAAHELAAVALRRAPLRRRCACGGTPGPTGECAECRARRLALRRQSLPSPAEARERAREAVEDVREGVVGVREGIERIAEAMSEKAEALAEKAEAAGEKLVEDVAAEGERWWTAGSGAVTRMDFDGFELRVSGAVPFTTAAVSGLRAKNPKAGGVDWTGPDKQDVPDKGPIPEGKYYLEPSEVETPKTHGFSSGPWGHYRTRLHESWTTALWRSATTERTAGFFLHQDGGKDGTAGCIGIQTDADNRVVHGLILANTAPIPVFVEYLPASKVAPGTPPAGAGGVQRSALRIGPEHDPAEAEADRVAGGAMRGEAPRVAARAAEPGAGAGPSAPPIVHEVLRGAGAPLDAATRGFFEPRLGLDLSGVRVHLGARAADSARAVDAAAYTVGNDLVFGAGRYAPGSSAGRRLLAHELAHVAQQGGAPELVQRQPNTPGDPCQHATCASPDTIEDELLDAWSLTLDAAAAARASPLAEGTERALDWYFRDTSAATGLEVSRRLRCVADSLWDTYLSDRFGCDPSSGALGYVHVGSTPVCTDVPTPVCLGKPYFRASRDTRLVTLVHECAHRVGMSLGRAWDDRVPDIYEHAARFRDMSTEQALENSDSLARFVVDHASGIPVSIELSAGLSGGRAWPGAGTATWYARLYWGAELQHPALGLFSPTLGIGMGFIGGTATEGGGASSPGSLIYSLVGGVRIADPRPGSAGAPYASLFGGPAVVIGDSTKIGAEAGVGLGYRWRWLDLSLNAGYAYDPTRQAGMRDLFTLGGAATITLGRH